MWDKNLQKKASYHLSAKITSDNNIVIFKMRSNYIVWCLFLG